jgi:VWFA-related protein
MLARLTGMMLCAIALLVALPTQGEKLVEHVEVPLVQIPVHVVKNGEPLRGLTADQFELSDRGKRREITGFDVVDLALIQAPAGDGRPWGGTPTVASLRHFMLVFDLSYSDSASLGRARVAVRDWAATALHPTDLVGVASYTVDRGPRLLLNFSSDREQVAAAISNLGAPEAKYRTRDPLKLYLGDANLGLFETSEFKGRLDGTDPLGTGDVIDDSLTAMLHGGYNALQDQRRRQDIDALSRSFRELATLMKAIQGRKYLVYLSEGFDASLIYATQDPREIQAMNSALETGNLWRVDPSKRFGTHTAHANLTDMLAEFRRADCIIETIDIAGIGGDDTSRVLPDRADGLHLLSSETGGQLHRNFADMGSTMQRLLDRTSVTYVLSFRPQKLKADGKFHKIRVKLKHPPNGARVHHRPGYYAPQPETELTPDERMMRTSQLIVRGGDDGVLATSILAAPFPQDDGKGYVPLLIETTGKTLLAGQTGNRLTAEVFVYALDSGGVVRDFLVRTIGVDLKAVGEQLGRSGLKFYGELELPPGDYSLRVLVRNSDTGFYALRTVPVQVPEFGDPRPIVLTPHVPEPRGKWLLAREPQDANAGRPFPFMLGAEPYLPAARCELRSGDVARLVVMGYNLDRGPLSLRAIVRDQEGGAVATFDLDLLERQPTEFARAERLLTRFAPRDLAPGEYTLDVSLDNSDGATSSGPMSFAVVSGSSR